MGENKKKAASWLVAGLFRRDPPDRVIRKKVWAILSSPVSWALDCLKVGSMKIAHTLLWRGHKADG